MYHHKLLTVGFILVLSLRQSSCNAFNSAKVTSGKLTCEEMREVCGKPMSSQRIVGGVNATLDAWPWMAAIFTDKLLSVVVCGGVLLNYRFVLTAAHCLRYAGSIRLRPVDDFTVRLGDLDIHSDDDGAHPLDYKVKNIISHECYDHNIYVNDIGLFKLSETVMFSQSILPICLPDSPEFANSLYTNKQPYIAGWGKLQHGGNSSSILKQVEIPVIQNLKCKKAFAKIFLLITDKNICAGHKLGGKDACQGDSGGPLMLKDSKDQMTVIGVISFGQYCANPQFPGVYTRVASYLTWIKKRAF